MLQQQPTRPTPLHRHLEPGSVRPMRRLLPLWSSLFAVLLLSQWAGAAAACLHQAATHATALCLVAAKDSAADNGTPSPHDHTGAAACPLCAPLPPTILPEPLHATPGPTPRSVIVAVATPRWTAPQPNPHSPLQPRAPPHLA